MWRNYDVITDEEPLSKQTLGRKFIPVSTGTTSVKIHHGTWELWSKIKWHVFYGPRCTSVLYYFAVNLQSSDYYRSHHTSNASLYYLSNVVGFGINFQCLTGVVSWRAPLASDLNQLVFSTDLCSKVFRKWLTFDDVIMTLWMLIHL